MQLVGVLLLGILHGVLLAAVVSILRFLGESMEKLGIIDELR